MAKELHIKAKRWHINAWVNAEWYWENINVGLRVQKKSHFKSIRGTFTR